MQSDHQHIDEFFRAKNTAWDAGADDLQQHWQQMLVMMPKTTGGVDSKPSYYRMLKWLGGVVAISVMIAIMVINSKHKVKSVVEEKLPQTKQALNAVASPPAERKKNVAIVPVKKQKRTLSTIPVIPITPAATDTVAIATVETPKPGAEALMSNFYEGIKKEGQEFSIPDDRDTTIIGKEGTVLTIKAKTFMGAGRVSITLTEYYQYDDILAAKLNTVSNGQQLVTGGMIHLQAERNGQQVQIVPGKSIILKMPTDNYDQDMQLFLDASSERSEEMQGGTLRAGSYRDGSKVKWFPVGQSQRLVGYFTSSIQVLDLTTGPYHSYSRGGKKIGKFFYDKRDISKEELRELLRKRYGTYYDKIKLRKAGRRKHRIEVQHMDFDKAYAAGLVSANDSIQYFKQRARDSVSYSRSLKKLKYYRFEITSLGWFNCDRFYENTRLTDLTINLGEGYEARQFVTHLVFTRLNSVINGYYKGSMVQFRGIPENEPVQLVSVGVKDGKVVSTITPYIVGKSEQKSPVFEETSPEAFRQKLEVLNKPNAPQ